MALSVGVPALDIDLVNLHGLEAVVALGCIDRLKFSNVDVCL